MEFATLFRRMPKDYRDHFHRASAAELEEEGRAAFADQRDSLTPVYLSLIPFGFAEFMAERTHWLPGGLILPMGFLLFWSFYYTYYKPNFLESRLGSPDTWNLTAIPIVLLGVCLWFLKYTVIELLHLLVLRWILTRPSAAQSPPRPAKPRPTPPRDCDDEVHWREDRTAATKLTDSHQQELVRALQTLGLNGDPSLDQIHHRYRELAKLFHPDLNPDVTDFGRRFIEIDQAYRKLSKARSRLH